MKPFLEENYTYYKERLFNLPSGRDAAGLTDMLVQLLFPITRGLSFDEYKDHFDSTYHAAAGLLQGSVQNADYVIHEFFKTLPAVRKKLLDDAEAICKSDPAAMSTQEVISVYPGFYAISAYRLAHELTLLDVPLIPRMITEYAHRLTGVDIHPKAKIGHRFTIDHGTGIVVGETTVIGDDVKLYQGVTLGALSVDKSAAAEKRHPTIENDVVIYAGGTVLGGKTVIGHHSIIGGNVWLTESVLPYSVVYHKSEIRIRTHKDFEEPINFEI